MALKDKYAALQNILKNMGGVVIGFSGGVDSTLLLKVAIDVLHEKALGVLSESIVVPKQEVENAKHLAEAINARLIIVRPELESMKEFKRNPINRCYICKSALFSIMTQIARKEGLPYIADGANVDDETEYRPGSKAEREFLARSPLREAGFGKKEIRELSRKLDLPTYNKLTASCLATRIPYNSPISLKKLQMIEQAENFLHECGFKTVRVRHYGKTARIELGLEELNRIIKPDIRNLVAQKLKSIGFTYITVDLECYRSGSMDEILRNKLG